MVQNEVVRNDVVVTVRVKPNGSVVVDVEPPKQEVKRIILAS
jgi:hypothetical protein